MVLDQRLLEILVCVQCKGTLVLVEGGRGLLCEACHLKYPVRDDVPVMLMEEALDLKSGGTPIGAARGGTEAQQNQVVTAPSIDRTGGSNARFRIVAGLSNGHEFALEKGTCRAIGRAVSDPNKTSRFHVDVSLTLDESTRNLVQQYVAKQFRRVTPQGGKEAEIGFRRAGDIVVNDIAVSRLHAMIFFDEVGVGILDLVSKNGTYVNGEEIESRLLRSGDTIELGETKIRYEG